MKARPDPRRLVLAGEVEAALSGRGLTLAGLFKALVSEDRDVARMVEAGSGHTFRGASQEPLYVDGRAVLDGLFLEYQPAWPAVLTGYDLFVEWADTSGARFPHVEPADRGGLLDDITETSQSGVAALRVARDAARFVHERYDAMIGLLRSGELEAVGHFLGSGEPGLISKAPWSAPRIRINFVENALSSLVCGPSGRAPITDGKWPMRHEKTTPLWTNVFVRRSKPEIEAGIVLPHVEPGKDKGGRTPDHLWETAYDHLVIRLGHEGFPDDGTKAILAEMMLECFEDMKMAKVPALGTISDWLRDNHLAVWNATKAPVSKRKRPSPGN